MCIAAVWLFNKCIYVYIVGFMKRLIVWRTNQFYKYPVFILRPFGLQ